MSLSLYVTLIDCSVFGGVIGIFLIALLLRQNPSNTTTRVGIALGVCFCSINLRTGLGVVYGFYGIQEPGFTVFGARLVAAMLAFLPALLLLAWRRSTVLEWRSRTGFRLFAGACCTGAALLVVMLFLSGDPLSQRVFDRALVLNRAVWLFPAFASILRLPLHARMRKFIQVTGAVYLVSSSLNLFWTFSSKQHLPRYGLLTLLLEAGILSSLLASFVFTARLRFVDVFVRWSVRLALLGSLSLVAICSCIYAADQGTPLRHPSTYLLCSLEILCLLLAGAPLAKWCIHWVDVHVLERFDLRIGLSHAEHLIAEALDAETLLLIVETELTKLIHPGTVQFVPAALHSPEAEFDLLIPIVPDGEVEHHMRVRVGEGRQLLTSGEISFLQNTALEVGLRLRRLTMVAARSAQAVREAFLRQQVAEAELRALRAQINPHFLFNSLNTVAELIVSAPQKAEQMTLSLSRVFRHILDQADLQFVSVKKEFDFLRSYLEIEQTRFGKDFQVWLDFDPELAHEPIPTLLLQPLVENAVRHGLARKGGRRSLSIRADHRSSAIVIEVLDNGVGFDVSLQRSEAPGVGLSNVRLRLNTIYGEKGWLTIDSEPMRGCCVSIGIPLTRGSLCEV